MMILIMHPGPITNTHRGATDYPTGFRAFRAPFALQSFRVPDLYPLNLLFSPL